MGGQLRAGGVDPADDLRRAVGQQLPGRGEPDAAADPLQLAMLTANPPTALLMLEQFGALGAGDWVVQNAANSGVGAAVVAVARERGLRTVNVVRRESAAAEVEALGGDLVLVDGPDLARRVRAALEARGAAVSDGSTQSVIAAAGSARGGGSPAATSSLSFSRGSAGFSSGTAARGQSGGFAG